MATSDQLDVLSNVVSFWKGVIGAVQWGPRLVPLQEEKAKDLLQYVKQARRQVRALGSPAVYMQLEMQL